LCKHLHLPVQSGSDRILAAMNRGYDRARYLGLVDKLRAACPEIRLTTDIIVGFPGEDDNDFAATMALLEEVRYAEIYSFLFSPRRGTAAAALQDDTPAKVKQARFDRMLALQAEISRLGWEQDVGRVRSVLVEGASKQGQGQVFGRTTWNRVVNFSGSVDLIGQLVPVRISRSYRNSQLGELVDFNDVKESDHDRPAYPQSLQ
jgi:tRNA-2-methylthio-N6-dimethylallyladenosine synthase